MRLDSRNGWREIEFPFETRSMMGPAVAMDGFVHFAHRKYLLPCSYDHVLSLDGGGENVSAEEAALRGEPPFENWGFARYGGICAERWAFGCMDARGLREGDVE